VSACCGEIGVDAGKRDGKWVAPSAPPSPHPRATTKKLQENKGSACDSRSSRREGLGDVEDLDEPGTKQKHTV
jgi:hypothetical protein